MMALASELTAAAVAVNAAELWPAGICTVAGTVTEDVLADVATVRLPLMGAFAAIVTVQLAVAELLIDAGVHVKPVTWTETPRRVVGVCVWLFKAPVMSAFWPALLVLGGERKAALVSRAA